MEKSAVLVLVTAQNCSVRNIAAGRELAKKINASLHVLNIQNPDTPAGELAGNIEKLYTVAKSCGADITIYYDKNPESAAVRYIEEQGVSRIVTGLPGNEADSGFLVRLCALVPEIPLTVVDAAGRCRHLSRKGTAESIFICGKAGVFA